MGEMGGTEQSGAAVEEHPKQRRGVGSHMREGLRTALIAPLWAPFRVARFAVRVPARTLVGVARFVAREAPGALLSAGADMVRGLGSELSVLEDGIFLCEDRLGWKDSVETVVETAGDVEGYGA